MVDDEKEGQGTVVAPGANIGLALAGRRVPVDEAGVLAGRVIAERVEIQASPPKERAKVAAAPGGGNRGRREDEAPRPFVELIPLHGLGQGDALEEAGDNGVGCHAVGFGVIAEYQAMAQHGPGYSLDVFGKDVVPPRKESLDAREAVQLD